MCLGAVAMLAAYSGCGGSTEDSSLGTAGSGAGNSTSGSASGGADGSTGSFMGSGTGTGGMGGDKSCASVEQEATLNSRPVDIVVAIDNSGSMGGEIEEVEVQMTQTFTGILDAAVPAIDYRVILVARHGNYSGQAICVAAPLGLPVDNDMDGHCDSVPAQPTDNPPKFFHHSAEVSSHDALCMLYDQFNSPDDLGRHPNGYSELLRDDSYKFFLVITDDNQSDNCATTSYDDDNTVMGGEIMAGQWDADMLALSPQHFGADTASRNYTFWSIVSLAPYMAGADPWGDPHPPDVAVAPIITAECNSGARNPGTGYQALSVLTGGYRYPTCAADENANPQGDYAKLFTLMAQGVIQGAQVQCAMQIPDPPAGATIDMNTLRVVYSSNGTVVESFQLVNDVAACDDHSFYIDNDTITLCPGACSVVQADDNAKLSVSYDCGGPPA
jgi:hypothetical protein